MATDTFTKEAQAQVIEVAPATQTAETPTQPAETVTKAEYDKAILKERQLVSQHTARIKQLESKAQLSERVTTELAQLREAQEETKALLQDQMGTSPETKTNYQLLQERRAQIQRQPIPQEDPVVQSQIASLRLLSKKLAPESPELATAIQMYSTQGYEATVEYLAELPKSTSVSKETAEQMKARLKAEARAEVENEMGINPNSVDTSSPRGGGGKRIYTLAELEDSGFVRKNLADITLAQHEGRIKE